MGLPSPGRPGPIFGSAASGSCHVCGVGTPRGRGHAVAADCGLAIGAAAARAGAPLAAERVEGWPAPTELLWRGLHAGADAVVEPLPAQREVEPRGEGRHAESRNRTESPQSPAAHGRRLPLQIQQRVRRGSRVGVHVAAMVLMCTPPRSMRPRGFASRLLLRAPSRLRETPCAQLQPRSAAPARGGSSPGRIRRGGQRGTPGPGPDTLAPPKPAPAYAAPNLPGRCAHYPSMWSHSVLLPTVCLVKQGRGRQPGRAPFRQGLGRISPGRKRGSEADGTSRRTSPCKPRARVPDWPLHRHCPGSWGRCSRPAAAGWRGAAGQPWRAPASPGQPQWRQDRTETCREYGRIGGNLYGCTLANATHRCE